MGPRGGTPAAPALGRGSDTGEVRRSEEAERPAEEEGRLVGEGTAREERPMIGRSNSN